MLAASCLPGCYLVYAAYTQVSSDAGNRFVSLRDVVTEEFGASGEMRPIWFKGYGISVSVVPKDPIMFGEPEVGARFVTNGSNPKEQINSKSMQSVANTGVLQIAPVSHLKAAKPFRISLPRMPHEQQPLTGGGIESPPSCRKKVSTSRQGLLPRLFGP